MATRWEKVLKRWLDAGLMDPAAAEKIRAFETSQAASQGLRWPVLLALAFGGLLLGAGVFLFVSAHWDQLSPTGRISLIVSVIGIFHFAGAFLAERFEGLSITLHGLGSAALGGGIFLAGQVFNLQEHWPAGLMLWALGAWIGWVLLRDWVQLTMAAVLTPAWLMGEWVADQHLLTPQSARILGAGLLLLALTYLSSRTAEQESTYRRALTWVGGIALFPCALILVLSRAEFSSSFFREPSLERKIVGWTVAFLLPMAVAFLLRRRAVWLNLLAAGWVAILSTVGLHRGSWFPYFWCAVGSIGLVTWGLKEARKERVNLGVVGFALTVLFFYFSSIMDKLGRSLSLIGLGVLFLAGGWGLERMRRKLVARVLEVRS